MANQSNKDAKGTRFQVASQFRDSDQYAADPKKPNYYKVGDDVSTFDADRLKDLVKRGLVEEVKVEEESK